MNVIVLLLVPIQIRDRKRKIDSTPGFHFGLKDTGENYLLC